jgi:hypothetical protein
MNDVNKMLPENSQFSEFGLSILRSQILKLHREYYPSSNLRKAMYIWWTLITVLFLSAVALVVEIQV